MSRCGAAGLGIALIPRLARGPVPDGVTIATVNPTVTREVYAMWPAETTQRPALHATLSAVGRVATSAFRSP